MTEDSIAWALPIVATLLGLIGALGLSLTPVRAWTLLYKRRIWDPVRPGPAQLAVAAVALGGIIFAVVAAVDTYPRIYRCLMETRCGANRSGGMINLAFLGFAVAVQEVVWLLAGVAQRRLRRNAI